jgi:uncharacterized membrane protein
VPENEVIPLDISVEEAMKLIVSGGLYSPTEPIQTVGGLDVNVPKVGAL